ncbi:MAG: hypothetical protein NUV91_04010 [Candidatus Omnitrophica bacterium]|nr:hypothetical protein [Candidatus Omnitrophota bacterium]
MDIGLYNMKYSARKWISGVLPLMKNGNPNTVSWSMIPVGAGIAACYYFAAQGQNVLYLAASVLTFLRMYLGTLDGLMAEYYQKGTRQGEIINRLTPELCDVMYLLALILAHPELRLLGITVLAIAWMTTFSGLVGLTVQKKIQSVGPVGQTDRLAALLVFTLLQYVSNQFHWNINFIQFFMIWAILGGILTIILRLKRSLDH